MGARLKNPPLVEAVCELRSGPNTSWDWTIPGRLFDLLGTEFPERAEVHRVGITVQQIGMSSAGPAVIEGGPDRVQLKRADGSAMVQVGPRLLAINYLRPYETWEVFRSLVLTVFGAYSGIADISELSRVGLRYINQIPQHGLNLDQILTVRPELSGSLKRPLLSWYQRYELSHENPSGVLLHQTALQVLEAGPTVMLDLDFSSTKPAVTDSSSLIGWLDLAHDRVEESFIDSVEPSLFEKLRGG